MKWRRLKRSGCWIAPLIVVTLVAACGDSADDAGGSAEEAEGTVDDSARTVDDSERDAERSLIAPRFEAVLQPVGEANGDELDDAAIALEWRLVDWGVTDVSVDATDGRVVVRGGGIDEATLNTVLIPARLELRPVLDAQVGPDVPLTEPEEGIAIDEAVLVGEDPSGAQRRYRLGPAWITGAGVSDANALDDPTSLERYVQVDLKSGPEGVDPFNELAAVCFARQPQCPTGQLAIVIDGIVTSAPMFQTDQFDGTVIISGDFSEDKARALALGLRHGALDVDYELRTFVTLQEG